MPSVDDITDALAQNIDPTSFIDVVGADENNIPPESISCAQFQTVEYIDPTIDVDLAEEEENFTGKYVPEGTHKNTQTFIKSFYVLICSYFKILIQ